MVRGLPRSKQRSLLLRDGRDQDCPVALLGARAGEGPGSENVGGRWGSIWALAQPSLCPFVQSATHAPQHLRGGLGEEHEVSVQGRTQP